MPFKRNHSTLENDPLWYKTAVIYELHVRSFFDANNDGIGDFEGLTRKLDYLQNLGVTALWLLPFYPSPLKDDGYDIADYRNVHSEYGTLTDFKRFLREAHERGLRVITELVLNHTSDQHPWFQRSRQAKPGTVTRDFYVWSETPDRYADTRIIFKDFESSNWSWDPVARSYYWHRFYSHQPDLNYDNPSVQRAVLRALDYWMKMGVDGMRLDAVPYLYEREGTNCENLPETHQFLKQVRAHIDSKFPNRMLLAEANQWPEDAVAYFGNGDESHMNFHFPLMPRLFMAIRLEDRFPLIDILEQTPEIPENCQWALFLRNHDELTLEMVTEEERDYMYRVYAVDPRARINLGIRRRLAPLLGNNRRKIELMNGLLFSLPGTPVLYYGDEIGMGDNIYQGDRHGVRTPMHWSSDRNAGFSRANPQSLYLPVIHDSEYHYESVNVETQQSNPNSLLWWMKRLIALRRRYRAFGLGDLKFLQPENRKVLAFTREYGEERILVIANLARFTQCAELDLSDYRGLVPLELFGRTPFPPIGELPYFVTLGPHSFYWFRLEHRSKLHERIALRTKDMDRYPRLEVAGNWTRVLEGRALVQLEEILPEYLVSCRWFGGKARDITSCRVVEALPVPTKGRQTFIVFIYLEYTEGDPERYLLPLAFSTADRASEVTKEYPQTIICEIDCRGGTETGLLHDALVETDFCSTLLRSINQKMQWSAAQGEVSALTGPAYSRLKSVSTDDLEVHGSRAEQSNSSIFFGHDFIMKVFRRVDSGINPDFEIGMFLSNKNFPNVPPMVGGLEYKSKNEDKVTLAVLQEFVPNEGDAWQYTLDTLNRYYERAMVNRKRVADFEIPTEPLLNLTDRPLPAETSEEIGVYLQSARLLGQRTAELHLILASDRKNPNFAPESYTSFARRSLYQSMRNLVGHVFRTLRGRIAEVPEEHRSEAEQVLTLRNSILRKLRNVIDTRITSTRIRCHGDFHLGQALFTGKDFIIIDFEGEPARPISERKLKRSPLRDVAGMLRSFHYAAYAALLNQVESGLIRPDELPAFDPWARFWQLWVSVAYLRSYLDAAGDASFIPDERIPLQALLEALLLEKATYELGYELNNRPGWIKIPIEGILYLMEEEAS